MTDPDDIPERRRTDQRLVAALQEMRDLKVGIADFAEAVQVRTAEFKNVVRQIAGLLAVLLIVLVVFSLWEVSRLNERLDHGHDTITCLLLVEPGARTAETLINCQRRR
jgi:hypothetical protein